MRRKKDEDDNEWGDGLNSIGFELEFELELD